MELSIREARLEDAGYVAVLLTELGYPTDERQARARLERLDAEQATSVLVAESAPTHEVVGLAAVRAETLLEHDRPSARLARAGRRREASPPWRRPGAGRGRRGSGPPARLLPDRPHLR
jgi:hypothetical protein